MRSGARVAVLVLALCFLLPFGALAQECEPGWTPGLYDLPGVDGTVLAFARFDDGSGEALYVGGGFTTAGPLAARGLARWDGRSWTTVAGPDGLGLSGAGVLALAIYDDGRGPALYAAGEFTSAGGRPVGNIARWDGNQWTPLGEGTDRTVTSLAVFDDGSGPALYAAGEFDRVDGMAAPKMARWDGSAWTPVAVPDMRGVEALAVYDDGDGAALHAAYSVFMPPGTRQWRVARLDGPEWTIIGRSDQAVAAGSSFVNAMAVYDDGQGPGLYVAGGFYWVDDTPASMVARWDGSAWSALGAGLDTGVLAMAVHDDGTGPALYAGGAFSTAGGLEAGGLARWDGADWSTPMPQGRRAVVRALATADFGAGPVLAMGGQQLFLRPDEPSRSLAFWDGRHWSLPREGAGMGLVGAVRALTAFDDGTGTKLVAGGDFRMAGDLAIRRVAAWDGRAWTPMGAGFNGTVNALAIFDDGSGEALYAAGAFTASGDTPASRIARWDAVGQRWLPLGEGLNNGVADLAVFDDGTGKALYAVGQFMSAGGVEARRVARWDGVGWSAVGQHSVEGFNSSANALAVFDDGTGPALYAGGSFTFVGRTTLRRIARWDGGAWRPFGTAQGADDTVRALAVADLGDGPALYAAGDFLAIDGQPASRVARWDGVQWSPVGVGVGSSVNALAAFDDGDGPALYAAGRFFRLGDERSSFYIARWDGDDWSPLGAGLSREADALAVYDDGSGPALYVGGSFTTAGGVASSRLARWGGCPPAACRADLDGDGVLTIFDFLAFQTAFGTGDLAADLDGDGELTVLDWLAFLAAFDAGCE